MPKIKDYGARYWRLEYKNAAQNSNKFYEVFIVDNGVCVLRWGRIGTAGQSKAHAGTYTDVESVGLRQVYAKQGKAYKAVQSDFKFVVDEETVDNARRGNTAGLAKACTEARADGQFGGARDAVLKHYADFSTQVQELLHNAATYDFEVVIEEYDALEKVWADIEDKHREVVTAMSLAKQTLMQKLVGAI